MAPGLGDGRGRRDLAPLNPNWEGSGQYLESNILCSGVGMVQGGQQVNVAQLWKQQGLSVRCSEQGRGAATGCRIAMQGWGGGRVGWGGGLARWMDRRVVPSGRGSSERHRC